jgi:Na+/phosphate symporter
VKNSTKALAVIILLLLVGVVVFVFNSIGTVSQLGNITTGTTTTVSSSTISTAAATIFASKPGAQYRSMVNRGAVDVWFYCNSTSTGFTALTGSLLRPSTTVELIEEAGTMWCTDNIYGITIGGTSIIATQER